MSCIATVEPRFQVLEIEVKIRIETPGSIRNKLERAGAVLHRDRHFEENVLFDLPGGVLYRKRTALRLRTSGKKSYLTFKGPKQKSRRFKVREEFETELRDAKQAAKILRSLGYREVFRYSKHRTVFRTKKLTVCLDETAVGSFMELEGDRSDIVRFARKLGIPKQDFIQTDYITMMKESARDVTEKNG